MSRNFHPQAMMVTLLIFTLAGTVSVYSQTADNRQAFSTYQIDLLVLLSSQELTNRLTRDGFNEVLEKGSFDAAFTKQMWRRDDSDGSLIVRDSGGETVSLEFQPKTPVLFPPQALAALISKGGDVGLVGADGFRILLRQSSTPIFGKLEEYLFFDMAGYWTGTKVSLQLKFKERPSPKKE